MSSMLFALQSPTFPTFVLPLCDLAEAERALILDKFRHVTMKWNQNAAEGYDKEEQKSHMIVETDVCLPLLASEESHISSNVLINYELLTKKVLIEWNLGIMLL